MTTFQESFCFKNDDEHRRYLNYIRKIAKERNKSRSHIIYEAIQLYVDRTVRLQQSKLDSFKDPLQATLDKLHEEYVNINSGRHSTWIDCLKANKIYTEQAIEYCLDKGWKVT